MRLIPTFVAAVSLVEFIARAAKSGMVLRPDRQQNFQESRRNSATPTHHRDLLGDIHILLASGMDPFFACSPDLGVVAVKEWQR